MWRYALASVPGTSHLRAGTGCQDHAQVLAIPPQGLIAVAADGAGSALHAAAGARAACAAFAQFAGLALGWIGRPGHLTDGFAQDSLHVLRTEIAAIAAEHGAPASAYACTLLGALVTEDSALFVQLGDGAIVHRGADTAWRLALPPQRGEHANETVFVTGTDALSQIQAVRIEEPIREFCLLTDGVEFLSIAQRGAVPHAAFFEHVMTGLRAEPRSGEAETHGAWLDRFLRSDAVNRRTDDDKTLVLASRLP